MSLLSFLLLAALSPLQAEWRALGPFGGSMQAVAVDRQEPGIVVAVASNGLVFRSANAGESWSPLSFPGELVVNCHALLMVPEYPHTLLIGVSSESRERAGVFRSRDSGVTWEQLPGMRSRQVWSLAASGGLIAAGAEDGLYLTADGGETWSAVSPAGQGPVRPVVSIAFDPQNRQVIYAGTPHLAWKTEDGGRHWTPIHSGMQEDSDVFSLVVDSSRPERIYAAACSGVYRSLRGGTDWLKLGVPTRTYFVAQHPAHAGVVFAGTAEGLMQSQDAGQHWRLASRRRARGIAFDEAHPGRIFVATSDAGILRSDDDGVSFLERNLGLCSRHLAPLAESSAGIVSSVLSENGRKPSVILWSYPGTNSGVAWSLLDGTVVRSDDKGRTWTPLPAPARFITMAIAQGGLLAASESELFHSTDGGQTWVRVDLPEVGAPIGGLTRLAGPAFALTAGSKILLSPDGLTWKLAGALPGAPAVRGVASDGAHTLLAATSAGMMRSADWGATWQASGGVLSSTSIEAVAAQTLQSHSYFAAAYGLTYESMDDGDTWRPLAPEGPAMGRITQLLPSRESDRLFVVTESHGAFVWSPR